MAKSSKQWLRRHVTDPYVRKARAKGYRSRAAYKLLEIDSREKLLRPGMVVLAGRPQDHDGARATGVPLLEGRGLVDGRAAAYVCRDMVCARPVTDVHDLQGLLTP